MYILQFQPKAFIGTDMDEFQRLQKDDHTEAIDRKSMDFDKFILYPINSFSHFGGRREVPGWIYLYIILCDADIICIPDLAFFFV